MSSSGIDAVLERCKNALPESQSQNSGTRQPYKAFEARGRQSRIELINCRGEGWIMSYSYLLEINYISSRGLVFIFTSRMFVVKGRRLDRIRSHLQDDEIRRLQSFNPQQHEPFRGNDVFIEDIEVFEPKTPPKDE